MKIAEPITDTVRADQMVEYAKGAENSISHDLAEPDDYIINSECRYFREHPDKGRRRSKRDSHLRIFSCRNGKKQSKKARDRSKTSIPGLPFYE